MGMQLSMLLHCCGSSLELQEITTIHTNFQINNISVIDLITFSRNIHYNKKLLLDAKKNVIST